jgi:hypothetical protein
MYRSDTDRAIPFQMQIITMGCCGGSFLVYFNDKAWNKNIKTHVAEFTHAYRSTNKVTVDEDETVTIFRTRELELLLASAVIFAIITVTSLLHFYVCLVADVIAYQQTFVSFVFQKI